MHPPEGLALFDRVAARPGTTDLVVTLSCEQRRKGRLRARCDSGEEVALVLARGRLLRGGTVLSGPHGRRLRIEAAPEALSEVRAGETGDLRRAAYHLGNRHVPIEIGPAWLRYAADHVLDEMVRGLGFTVDAVTDGFEPESGAYAPGHRHGHVHA